MNRPSSSGTFLRKSATWAKNVCRVVAVSEGMPASSMDSSMSLTQRSLARKLISNGAWRILRLGWPRFSVYVVSAPSLKRRKSLRRSSAPVRSSFGYMGPRMSSVGTFL